MGLTLLCNYHKMVCWWAKPLRLHVFILGRKGGERERDLMLAVLLFSLINYYIILFMFTWFLFYTNFSELYRMHEPCIFVLSLYMFVRVRVGCSLSSSERRLDQQAQSRDVQSSQILIFVNHFNLI